MASVATIAAGEQVVEEHGKTHNFKPNADAVAVEMEGIGFLRAIELNRTVQVSSSVSRFHFPKDRT
ncbi:MAG: hypothetical protein R3E08_01530 [Thiotrichaceae bacterium]